MNNALSRNQLSDIKVLAKFVEVYCNSRHSGEEFHPLELPPEFQGCLKNNPVLCESCSELLIHGIHRRRRCPLDPKPSCRKCHIHCYSSDYRAKIREIMSFSGRKMIMKGRIDYLLHYFT